MEQKVEECVMDVPVWTPPAAPSQTGLSSWTPRPAGTGSSGGRLRTASFPISGHKHVIRIIQQWDKPPDRCLLRCLVLKKQLFLSCLFLFADCFQRVVSWFIPSICFSSFLSCPLYVLFPVPFQKPGPRYTNSEEFVCAEMRKCCKVFLVLG